MTWHSSLADEATPTAGSYGNEIPNKIGDAPCDTCAQAAKCKSQSLACREFTLWLIDGKAHDVPRDPSRERFEQMMKQ